MAYLKGAYLFTKWLEKEEECHHWWEFLKGKGRKCGIVMRDTGEGRFAVVLAGDRYDESKGKRRREHIGEDPRVLKQTKGFDLNKYLSEDPWIRKPGGQSQQS